MKQEQIMGIIRHALSAIGGFVVLKGHMSEAEIQQLLGILMTLIAVAWSVTAKK